MHDHHICSALILIILFYIAKCENQPSIVIVGAGSAGIAAATKLLKHNFTNIKVLEAENRIGGRINSVKFGDVYVDVGAEWCHGQGNNIVYDMAKDLDILRHTEFIEIPVLSNGKPVRKEFLNELFEFMRPIYEAEELEPEIEKQCSEENSVGKCFKTVFNSSFVSKYKNEDDRAIALAGLNVIRGYVTVLESALNWDDVAIGGSEYQAATGDQNLNWNGLGSKTVLELLMQKYPPGQQALPIDDKILLNKEVASIANWSSNLTPTEVKCQDGSVYKADHVIFTPSLGVLKANYDTLFNPALPRDKVETIQNMGFGAIAKVIMHFPKRWWNEDLTWIFLWTREDIDNLKSDYPNGVTKNGKPWLTHLISLGQAENNPKVLIAWYSENVFPELEELSDEVILESHKYVLKRFLGNKYNVTDPDKILRSKWYTNPHFRGTYSYESVKGHATGGSKFQRKLAEPLLNDNGNVSVQFAGEATNPIHFSTVHGAIETGYREAERIIDFYKKV